MDKYKTTELSGGSIILLLGYGILSHTESGIWKSFPQFVNYIQSFLDSQWAIENLSEGTSCLSSSTILILAAEKRETEEERHVKLMVTCL